MADRRPCQAAFKTGIAVACCHRTSVPASYPLAYVMIFLLHLARKIVSIVNTSAAHVNRNLRIWTQRTCAYDATLGFSVGHIFRGDERARSFTRFDPALQ